MAIAYVQSRAAYFSGNSGNLAFSSNVAAGNLLVVTIGQHWAPGNKGESVVSDSQENVYTKADDILRYVGDASMSLEVWYTFAASAAACTVTVNPADATSSTSMFIHEFSGATPTSPIDVQDTNTGDSNSPSAGPITTTNANDLLFAVSSNASYGGVVDITPDGDYAQMQEYNNGNEAIPMHSQYRIVSSTLEDAANWTLAASWNWGGWVVAFKAAAAAAGNPWYAYAQQ